MGAKVNLVGERFGKLTVISFDHMKGGQRMWLCLCDCGSEKMVCTRDLRSGNTRSCGCKRTDTIRAVFTTHGMAGTDIYNVWCTIVQRCCNTKSNDYPNYGGRGIVICEEWRRDFRAFYNYVSQLPHFGEQGYSLDRINNDGNYEPDNVRWATNKEQANNKRPRHKKKEI